MATEDNKEFNSFGEHMVGASFNPSQDPDVAELKELYAKIIDKITDIKNNRSNQSYKTNVVDGEALRSAMTAQMWAVKAATFKD